MQAEQAEPDQEVRPRFLRIPEVARELAIKDGQVRALLKAGELPGLQIGPRGLWRIERTRLEAYIVAGHEHVQQAAAAGILDDGENPDVPDE